MIALPLWHLFLKDSSFEKLKKLLYKLFILQSVRDLILELLLHEDSWLRSWSPPEEG